MWAAISRHLTSEAATGNKAVRQTRPMSERPDIEAVVIPPGYQEWFCSPELPSL
jgi:hypothetical protein